MSSRSSIFAINIVGLLLIAAGLAAISNVTPAAASDALASCSKLAQWAFVIGVIYGMFRVFGVRIDFLEWFYQHIPFGWSAQADASKPQSSSTNETPSSTGGSSLTRVSDTQASSTLEINWERVFSVEYIRYAGLLLIISAFFALLFKIEWQLLHKIIASFIGGGLSLVIAEKLLRRGNERTAGVCFLVSFALIQFACTLLFKHMSLPPAEGYLSSVSAWLLIKFMVTLIATAALLRYRASFVPVSFCLVAYSTPISLLRVVSTIPLYPGLVFIVLLAALVLISAYILRRYELLLVNTLCANVFLVSLYFSSIVLPLTGKKGSTFFDILNYRFWNLANNYEPGLWALAAIITVFVLQLTAGSVHNLLKRHAAPEVETAEIICSHVLSIGALIAIQSTIYQLAGYYGITLLLVSAISIVMFLLLRAQQINNGYTQVLFNIALVISAIGMFIQTKGSWTAIVFLLFSCGVIYTSFVLGTLRSRIYSFVMLFVSLVKLYFECAELFDSIPGTVMILIVGLILFFLSFKLETIKSHLKS